MQFNCDDITDINPPSWLPVVQVPVNAAGRGPLPTCGKGETLVIEMAPASRKAASMYPSTRPISSSDKNRLGYYELHMGLIDNYYQPGKLVDLYA